MPLSCRIARNFIASVWRVRPSHLTILFYFYLDNTVLLSLEPLDVFLWNEIIVNFSEEFRRFSGTEKIQINEITTYFE